MTVQATEGRPVGPSGDHVLRPATADDLVTCAGIWREALNDYLGRLAQPDIPDEVGPILRLYAHLLATDPTTFVVAERAADAATTGPAPIDGFVVALRREDVWFLSMLFVRPHAQARGLGRALIDAASPARATFRGARATATDSAQPISNALYASLGMVPRVPLLRLVGLVERPDRMPRLPGGIEVVRFEDIGSDPDGLARAALDAELNAIDREVIGFSHPVDHEFAIRDGRHGFLFRDRGGSPVGYGYASESGRVGPIASIAESLLAPMVGHLLGAVRPRGAFGIWVPGTAGDTAGALLGAGFRLESFPVLLCWDRPFADFGRYVPMSPGLL
jgi:GNAT superfamily N-acetyltransferase